LKFEVKDLPKPPKILAFIGPGFILAAFAQGSGELIWWPYLVAKYKDALLWLMPIAFTMQLWINLEVGRYTMLTGESIIKGFYRVSKYILILIFLLNFISWIWIGGYLSASATAVAELGPFEEKSKSVIFWSYLLLLLSNFALLSRRAYDCIEKLEKFVGVFCFISLLSVAVLCEDVRSVTFSFFKSFLSVHYPSIAKEDYKIFLTAVAFAGLGGTANLFYSYWLREKGIGMARKGGGIFRLNKRNEGKLRRWVKILWIDNGIGVYLNFITTVLTALLAYAILANKGLYPKGWDLASVQSEFLASTYGDVGRVVFLLIATFFLADTWIVLVYSLSKINAEVFSLLFKKDEETLFRIWIYIYVLASILIIPLKKPPEFLITLCGVMSFLSMIIYIPILAYITWIYLPRIFESKKVAPSLFSKICLLVAFIFYLALFLLKVYFTI